MAPADRDNPETLSPDLQEERIGGLLNEYFDRKSRGEDVSESAFLAEHPEYANQLREHLRGLELIRTMGSDGSGLPATDQTLPARGSSAAEGLPDAPPRLPEIVGYDVLKQIGRGGMGVVYKAVQKSTKRTVALKVLLEGPFASDVARKRFEREIALAAQLRHPNIIPIHDSGNFDGRLYYAMEHVYGQSLTDFVRGHKPPIPTRLKIFAAVCDAIGHAHQRGVIHRDIKPSNVLVDGSGTPHVLDFGLAKAGSIADMTTSMTAQIIGTPAYMSPEQAGGDPGGVDTRSDVYSLGVVLYELLTDQTPYDTNVSIGRVLNNIAHAEPVPPRKRNPEIDADLEAIVLKSLEKDRDLRYQSVDALAGDIRRHMKGEPISAVPVTSFYLFRKVLVRQRRLIVLIACLLVAGGGASLFARRSSRIAEQSREKISALEQHQVAQNERVAQLESERQALQRQQEEAVRKKKSIEMMVNMALPDVPAENRRILIDLLGNLSPEEVPKLLARELARTVATGALLKPPTATSPPGKAVANPPVESSGDEKKSEAYERLLRGILQTMAGQGGGGEASSRPAATSLPAPESEAP